MTRTSIYRTWQLMRLRCTDPDNPGYFRYGARGITVCQRWMESFENFRDDMGPRPSPLHTLERKDNSLGYSPDNCVWATKTEQARNRRTNHRLTLNGETRTIAEWSERLGIGHAAILWRVRQGWPMERVLSLKDHRRQRASL